MMRILHCVLILAFAILLKNISCDSSNNPLPNSPLSYFSSPPKPKASPIKVPATNTKLRKVHPRAPAPPPPPPPPPPKLKVTAYILALQWPIGVCTGNSGVACKISPMPTEFKIHGLWPQFLASDPPTKSNETDLATKLANITTDLNNYWPNLRNEKQQVSVNLKFWEHEWTEHGSESEMGLLEYFQQSLNLYKNYGGLKGALNNQGIKATLYATYELKDIEAALKKIYGVSCTVVCNIRNSSTGKNQNQIQEIRLKFTNDFKRQNNVASSTCGNQTTQVMFPAQS